MIDIKELNIGNYLRVAHEGLCIKKGTIIKINGIDAENKFIKKGLVGAISCHPLDEDQLDGGIWLAYLEPIEITPEILEKNGWKFHAMMSDYPADYVIAVGEYNIRVNHLDDENLWCFTIHSDNENIRVIHQFNILFVHQLQNALTLCGIDKEIELL